MIRCAPGNCRLELTSAGGILGSWPLATLAPGVVLNTPSAAVLVNSVVPFQSYAARLYRPTLRTRLMALCDWLLPALTALMSLPALAWIGLRVASGIRRRSLRPLTVFALSRWRLR